MRVAVLYWEMLNFASVILDMGRRIWLALCFLMLSVASVVAADKSFTLVIDAGHGGHDAGAKGAFSMEKNINLAVALEFGRLVKKHCSDVKVIFTRDSDFFVPLMERANIANRAKADLFISVHTNALPKGAVARGFEVYTLGMHRAKDNLDVAMRENSVISMEKGYKQTYAGFNPNSSENYIMFEFMQGANMERSVDLARMIQETVVKNTGRADKGVHQAGFLVLRETSMPSCLIELGFISTPDEEEDLNKEDVQNDIARNIYRAFVDYKKKYGSQQSANYRREDDPIKAPSLNTKSTGKEGVQKTAAKTSTAKTSAAKSAAEKDAKTSAAKDTNQKTSTRVKTVIEEDKTAVINPPSIAKSAVQKSAATAKRDTTVVQKQQPQTKNSTSAANRQQKKPADDTQQKKSSTGSVQNNAQQIKSSTGSVQNNAQQKKTSAVSAQSSTQQSKSSNKVVNGKPVFKVQILAAATKLDKSDKQLKGTADADFFVENGMYKYTIGSSADYSEIYQLRKSVLDKFPEAFIIAFKDGKKTNVAEAIKAYRENKAKSSAK